jgi:regulatory protein
MLNRVSETRKGTARQAPPMTPQRLEQAGLNYLARFAASAAHLRRILMRRVHRSEAAHATDSAALAQLITALIARWIAAGLLDDTGYAGAKAARLHKRGVPRNRIRAKLEEKGIAAPVIDGVLNETADIGSDLAAAAALARRRRLGPYRLPELRPQFLQKDLGSLARAGFDRRTAETVLRAEDPDALAALLEPH